MGQVLLITSGKGGVGKTTAAANLGAALADRGEKVILLDADMGLRNLDAALGLENRVVYDLTDVIRGTCPLHRALIAHREHPGLFLLPAPAGAKKGDVAAYDLLEVVAELRSRCSWVIADSPAGIDRGFRRAAAGADRALVVTSPEVTAVRDAMHVIRILTDLQVPLQLMVNRFRPRMARRGDAMDLEAVVSILEAELLGVVCEDARVVAGNNAGEPAVDMGGPVGAAYRRMAARLLGEDIPIRDPSRGSTLGRTLAELLRRSG